MTVPLSFFKQRFLQHLERYRKLHLQRGPAVHQASRCCLTALGYRKHCPTPPAHRGPRRSRPYTASMAVRTEYSVVKMVSLGVSANCPRKAAFTEPSGITSGRSPAASRHKECGDIRHHGRRTDCMILCQARRSLPPERPDDTATPAVISLPVHSFIGFFT